MNYFIKAKKKKKWIFSLKMHEKQVSLPLIFSGQDIFSSTNNNTNHRAILT